MTVDDALRGVRLLYIETSPVIYFVEDHPGYADKVEQIFVSVVAGQLSLLTSVITRTETLTKPIREGEKGIESRLSPLFSAVSLYVYQPCD